MSPMDKETDKTQQVTTKYDNKSELIDLILSGMRGGLSCYKACVSAGVPNSTFMTWVDADKELAERYARAREDLIEKIAEETIEIADAAVGKMDSGATDSGMVQKQRLQIDTRKWLLSKLAPKKYGEKITHAGDKENPLSVIIRGDDADL